MDAGTGDPSKLSESFRLDEEDPSLLGRLEFEDQFVVSHVSTAVL